MAPRGRWCEEEQEDMMVDGVRERVRGRSRIKDKADARSASSHEDVKCAPRTKEGCADVKPRQPRCGGDGTGMARGVARAARVWDGGARGGRVP